MTSTAFSSLLPVVSIRRSPPSGSVTASFNLPLARSINSRLPPPRSPAIPSASTKPIMMPWAARRASVSPDNTSILHPHAASPRRRNSGPLSASRTAAVAITVIYLTSRTWATVRNRRNAWIARSTASGARLPVDATERPSPHKTFSLNSGVGDRTTPS